MSENNKRISSTNRVEQETSRLQKAFRTLTVTNGEVDIHHFANTPEGLVQVQETAIPHIRRRSGIGAQKIYKEFVRIFGAHAIPQRTIQTRLTNLAKKGEEFVESPKLFQHGIPAECSRYISKLSLLRTLLLSPTATMTPEEQYFASKLMYVFNDPEGKKIDLWAQFTLIFEYAERDKHQEDTDDLDALVMYAPWEDNGVRYDLALHSDKSTVDTPPYPFLRLLMPEYEYGRHEIHEVLMGQVAHLGLPFLMGFSRKQVGTEFTAEFRGFTNKTKEGAIWFPLRVQDQNGNWISTYKEPIETRKSWCDSEKMIDLALHGGGSTISLALPGQTKLIQNENIKREILNKTILKKMEDRNA